MSTYIYPPLDSAPSDLYQKFVTMMQSFIPNWQPQSGNLDDWIAQAMSVIVAQLTEISSDVATAIYRYFGAFIANLPPIPPQQAQGLVTITTTDTIGHSIPAGTDFLWLDASGNTHGFSTVTQTTISPGASSVSNVAVTADIPGAAANGIVGNYAGLVTPLAWIANVQMQFPTSNGLDAEDDNAYLNRLRTLYTLLTPKPVVANDFSTLALQQPNIGRAVTLDGFDPGNQTVVASITSGSASATGVNQTAVSGIPVGAGVTGANIPTGTFVTATNPASGMFVMSVTATGTATGENVTIGGSLRNGGEVSVFVTDLNGNAQTPAEMGTVQQTLANDRLGNFLINVLAPTYTAINVAANVVAYPNQNVASVQAAVIAAIQAYINQLYWGIPPNGQLTLGSQIWVNENVVRLQKVEQVILNVPGVHYVSSLTLNGGTADITLPGVVPLPTLGTSTVNVSLG